MTVEDAFLQEICQNPDDDAVRLVYADWLDENGQPERAEFIRLQIQRDRSEDHVERVVMSPRESNLLEEHGSGWTRGLPGLISDFGAGSIQTRNFRRGFIECATVAAQTFVQHAACWLERTPLRSVRLLDAASCMALLAGCPQLACLTGLSLAGNCLNDQHVRILVDSPYLTRLSALGLSMNRLSIDGVEALASSPRLQSLTSLGLSDTFGGDVGAQALADSRQLKSLRGLGLCSNGIGDEGLLALVNSRHLTRLSELWLGENLITHLGVRGLATARNLRRLRVLSLFDNPIGRIRASDVAAVLDSNPNLRVDLSSKSIHSSVRRSLRRRYPERVSV